MLILGIESSCDETAAAVLRDDTELLSSVVNSQIEIHSKYGGVVPELASRHHMEAIYPVVKKALTMADVTLDDIDCLAVTRGPGLVGCLLVGYSFAKAISMVRKIPYVGVDHMAGHLLSIFLSDRKPTFPYISLAASGGHSSIFLVKDQLQYQLLGRTRDDAAGEAFDKVAKLLGLGYPGGPIISEVSAQGDPNAISFPRAWLEPESFDFSFSGLKTAVANYVNQKKTKGEDLKLPDICASFQEAVVEVLVEKSLLAAKMYNISNIVLAGGVASNPRLRSLMKSRGEEEDIFTYLPSMEHCTDNAAMIALAGYHLFKSGKRDTYDLDVYSRMDVANLT